jgi:hypothetical protein
MPTPNLTICILCDQPIANQPAVPTTDGRCVHIGCADQQATQAYMLRERLAILHAIAILCTAIRSCAVGAGELTIVGVSVWCIVHMLVHRHWWYHTVFHLIIRWRIRKRETEK